MAARQHCAEGRCAAVAEVGGGEGPAAKRRRLSLDFPILRLDYELMPEIAEAQAQSTCVVCGPANEHGLHLAFEVSETGEVSAGWTPTPRWEGFRGIVHGGIVSTVLDEAMSKAVAATGTQALTCELRVRLRKSVTSGETYNVRAWIVERKRRRIATEAVITGANGQEHARAWGTFLSL